jgi:hypothetical protein
MDFFPNFKWAVPHAFGDALAVCRFEQGDILYDTPLAYQGTWGESEKHINYSIQINHPPRSLASKVDTEMESAFASNWRSKVVFELYNHKDKSSKVVETTQGNLYRMLWNGNLELNGEDEVSPPRQAMQLLEELPVLDKWICKIPKYQGHNGGYFLLPFDKTSKILNEKHRKLLAHLGSHLVSHELISMKHIKISAEYVPTSEFAIFLISNTSSEGEVIEAIKKAFYRPAKDSKSGKDFFKVKSHGLLKI